MVQVNLKKTRFGKDLAKPQHLIDRLISNNAIGAFLFYQRSLTSFSIHLRSLAYVLEIMLKEAGHLHKQPERFFMTLNLSQY